MDNELHAALHGGAWAMSGLLYGVGHVLDDEGRPLGERRAPSDAKKDVPIVLRPCPYGDARHGMPMNVSALVQVMAHVDDVAIDIASFRARVCAMPPSWETMLIAVIDQLAGPALYLLDERREHGPIPTRLAVGHKLAAGFFQVVRQLLRDELRGIPRTVTCAAFVHNVLDQRALIGASEVCAGPLPAIERMTEAFFGSSTEGGLVEVPQRRVDLARALCRQIVLGLMWEIIDRAAERRVFFSHMDGIVPRNRFIEEAFAARAQESARDAAQSSAGVSLHLLAPELREELEPLVAWLSDVPLSPSEEPAVQTLRRLIANGQGGLVVRDDRIDEVARGCLAYLRAHRGFWNAAIDLEGEVRRLLSVDDAPQTIKLNGFLFPHPHALRWVEASLGHTLVATAGPSPLTVKSVHSVVEIPS